MVDAEKLVEAICQSGYTISSFAVALGMNRSTLWRKINGKSAFNLDEVQKALSLLNVEDPRCIFLLQRF